MTATADRVIDHVQTDEERQDAVLHPKRQDSAVDIKDYSSYEAARSAAADQVLSSNARFLPCVLHQQGKRTMVTLVMPYAMLRDHIRFNSTPKKGDARANLNRVLMPDHVATIKEYIEHNNERYILPGMTLNAAADVEVMRIGKPVGGLSFGFMVFSATTMFVPVDGQHRTAALVGYEANGKHINGVLDDNEDIGHDGVSIQLTLESSIDQLHQDFADAARTKPINANILAVYDLREPVNNLVNYIAENSELLRGRTDTTSKTLSARTQAVFLLSSLRSFLKVFVLGSTKPADLAFEREVAHRFEQAGAKETMQNDAMRLFDTLTAHMAPWNEIAKLPLGHASANKIPDWRKEYINLTGTGLVLLGGIGYELTKANLSASEQTAAYSRLAMIDWRRSNSLWIETGLLHVIAGKYEDDGTPKLDVTRQRVDIERTVARIVKDCALVG